MNIEKAYGIIKAAHERMGWRPTSATTRDQRNAWFEAGVAAVHYGHPVLNPDDPDPNWCIKNGGGGRPQSDDVVVHRQTRAYYDLILGTGRDDYSWHIGRHNEPLPPEQPVYPPDKRSLALFDALVPGLPPTPPIDPGEPVTPDPPPSGPSVSEQIAALKMDVNALATTCANMATAIGELAAQTGDLRVRQETLFDEQTRRLFGLLVDEKTGVAPAGIAEEAARKTRKALEDPLLRVRIW